MSTNVIRIAEPSIMSLLIHMEVRGNSLSSGTGFLVEHAGRLYLNTNRHNVRGRRNDTDAILSPTPMRGLLPTLGRNAAMNVGSDFGRQES
jgi:hypothetical protein